ncbi:hypothetical protein CHUAL_007871 [Chamberlinius hualienensis]
MKINEKNLAAYSVSTTPVDKDGWLLKRGEVNKGFQRRWFVLKGNLLFYSEKKTDKEPIGLIILEGCTIELAEYEEHYAFKIIFHGAGDRTYILGADSQETMESWMKALACASYDYMKMMVCQLQQQLDELIELEKAHVSIFEGADVKGKNVSSQITGDIGNRTPVAPARRKHGGSTNAPSRKAPNPPPPTTPTSQRINPFNRWPSDEDVDKLSTASALPNSVPASPQMQRQAASFKLYYNVPRKRTEEILVRNGTTPKPSNGLFYRLHEVYGSRIKKDIEMWKFNFAEKPVLSTAQVKHTVPVGQLIEFES